MDRLQQIASEIIRLYRQQLNLWTLGKITTLKDADLLQYDRRRDRIEPLRRELEHLVRTGKRGPPKADWPSPLPSAVLLDRDSNGRNSGTSLSVSSCGPKVLLQTNY